MKTKLLFVLLVLTSFFTFSQNVWIGEGTDTNWSNVDNWSMDSVPVPSDIVIIPTGFNVNADSLINVLSLTVEGNSVLNIQSGMTFSNPCVFRQNTTINFFNGIINGQGGILTSEGTINVLITNLFDLSNSTTLNNLGTINFTNGFMGIGGDSVLNNSGTLNFNGDGFSIASSFTPNVINNTGLIRTSFPSSSGEAFIGCPVINTGTIQVEVGTLNLNSTATNLSGGLYNVAADATLNLNGPTTVTGIISGNVFGNLNWNDDLIVTTNVFFNFGGNGIINCTGDLEGGGTLTNQTTINQIGGSALEITEATTLENEGVIQVTSGPGFAIGLNSEINNLSSGVIDILVDGGNINSIGFADPSVINNSGLLHVSLPDVSDQSIIGAQLNNNNGTLQVDNGTLWLSNENIILTDGTYNIASNGTLLWTQPITIFGSLSGGLNGNLDWSGDLIVPTSASFDFTGDGSVEWSTNELIGGGVLTNNHVIQTLNGSNKIINGATTLLNNGTYRSAGFVRIGTNSTLNNSAQGIIDIDTQGSSFGTVNSAPHNFINTGLLVASLATNKTVISAPLNNFGMIEATSAEIEFTNMLTNETTGIIKGGGLIDLPSTGNFTNNGVFAPGLSPGTLSVQGDFVSNSSSVLDIELNGSTQGTEYDLLAITGNADFDGDVQITLGFNPNINDEFIIATTTNTINTCSVPASATASFGGINYEFDVLCRNTNELVLTVANETLGAESFEANSSVILYPNPASDIIYFSDTTIERIEVFNLNGKLIITSANYSISIKELSEGIYIIKGINETGHSTVKRFIKN